MNTKLISRKALLLLTLFAVKLSFAQRSLKFENGGGPTGSGPSTNDQTITFYNGNAGVYNPTTKVTYKLSNQQYTTVEGASLPGLVFGTTVNGATNGNAPVANALYPLMNSISNSQNMHYATGGATPAIDITNDYGVELMTIADALINSNGSNKIATNTKDIYYGDLTLTFSRPVNNPVIHFTGMGGFFQLNSNSGTLGFAAGFELTDPYTISRLAGNNFFRVTGKKIDNSAGTYNSTTGNTAPAASSGSIRVNGNNITTLTFKVYLSGDGQGTVWSSTSKFNGDALLVGVSLTTYDISGNVFNDANGMSDNTVNGPGTNAGGLNAVLIDPATGNVLAVAPVNANGSYSFTNVLSAGYAIAITKDPVTAGDRFAGVVLPEGWTATGENLGTDAGNDGNADGILTNVQLNSNVTNANFGIEQMPVSDNKEQTISTPSGGTIPQGTLTTAVSGHDAEDGALGNANPIVITELPTNGTLYYNNSPVTAGQTIDQFDPSLLSFTNLQGGTTETAFKYSFVDAAGKQSSTPGIYTVKWDTALPVMFGPVTAYWLNGQLIVNWSTLMEQQNDHFEIEGSIDGVHFTSLGSVASKAPNGNSTAELQYNFSRSMAGAASMAGITFLLAGLLFLPQYRRNRFVGAATLLLITGTVITSCSKNTKSIADRNSALYIRVVQVDKDGATNASKTIKVTGISGN
ncbi:hypothetical protein [Niabella sp.]|uniref:hypothetical protein n=1 Tax=Niabella sp. TaxID=1962976 RepID=UPI00262A1678|nr:hypothetical protein [Niabella sp.]